MWKFADSIPDDILVEIATGWIMDENGDKYTDLHVRGCSKDQRGIGFKYALPADISDEELKREYKKFFHKMTDQLKRMFGNDFVGWDVSSSIRIIK